MKKVITIPNVISIIRIILIPFIAVMYFNTNIENNYVYTLILLIVSGLSDIVDGFIARHFNLVSDIGKVLDPVADKLTQAVVLFCLSIQNQYIIPMFCVLFIKELLTLFAATYLLKNGTKPISAKWWGKLSTVTIYTTIFYSIAADYFTFLPKLVLYILMVASIVCMLISMIGYMNLFLKHENKSNSKF